MIELKGHALDRFLLRKYSKTWDSSPLPYVTVDDLDQDTFEQSFSRNPLP